MKLSEAIEYAAHRIETHGNTLHLDVRRVGWGDKIATAVTFLIFPIENKGNFGVRAVRYGFVKDPGNVKVLHGPLELREELRRIMNLPTFQRLSYEDNTGFKVSIAWAGSIDEFQQRAQSQTHPDRANAYTWPALGEERIFNPTSLRDYPSILDM